MIDAATAILYIIKDLSAVISLLLIMRFIFSEKLSIGKIKVSVFSSLIILNSLIGFFMLKNITADYDSIIDFTSNLIYILSIIFMTEKVGKVRIIFTVFVYIYTVDMLYALISAFSGSSLITEYTINIIAFSAVCIAIYLLCVRTRINILPEVFADIPVWIYIILLCFELTCYYKEFGVSASWYKTMYFVSVAGIVVCLFYMLFKISLMAYKQNEIMNQMQLLKENFESQNSGDEEIRRFRHDYKNHMIVISTLLSSGKVKDATEYTQKLGESVKGTVAAIKTGNLAADAIINHKAKAAFDNNIEIIYTGYIPTKCIEDIDICAVLSNLLDNAIEATEKCSTGRVIKIEANLVNEFFILSVSNPYISVKTDKRGNLRTTKKDKANHGIGMKNIARIVEKYNGAMFTEQEYSIFTTNIRMKTKRIPKSTGL